MEKGEGRGSTRPEQRAWTLGWAGICVPEEPGGSARKKGREAISKTTREPKAEPAPWRADRLR